MITCKECKFWRRGDIWTALEDERFGSCRCPKLVYADTVYNKRTSDMLIYQDYEGFEASFDTGEDFGCIHGEAK